MKQKGNKKTPKRTCRLRRKPNPEVDMVFAVWWWHDESPYICDIFYLQLMDQQKDGTDVEAGRQDKERAETKKELHP